MKKTIVTITMAVVMAFSATVANAGIIVSDFTKGEPQVNCGIMISDLGGIIVSDFGGIIVSDLGGIIVAGLTKDGPCKENTEKGIIVSDLGGIIVSD